MSKRYQKYKKSIMEYYRKNKKRIIQQRVAYNRKRHREFRKKLLEIFGSECLLCKSTERIHLHNIYANHHERGQLNAKRFQYYIEHKDEFVPLCYRCHMAIHTLGYSGANPDLICDLIRKVIMQK